jgi:hypothetical protein
LYTHSAVKENPDHKGDKKTGKIVSEMKVLALNVKSEKPLIERFDYFLSLFPRSIVIPYTGNEVTRIFSRKSIIRSFPAE